MSIVVLTTRPSDQAGGLHRALAARGLEPVTVPTIRVEPVPPGGELDAMVAGIGTYDWMAVTSANGARALVGAIERSGTPGALPRWAAIGSGTAHVIEAAGQHVAFMPSIADGAALAEQLPIAAGQHVLVVRGDRAGTRLADRLRARGASVDDVVGYRTIEGPADVRPRLRSALERAAPSVVVFASGSAVRGLVALSSGLAIDVLAIPAVAIGPHTAAAARTAGFAVIATATSPDAEAIAAAVALALQHGSEEPR